MTTPTGSDIIKEAGLDNSRWGRRILIAEQCGVFTADDEDDASSWVTCACGELDKSLMHDIKDDDGPIDHELRYYGIRFETAVENDEVIDAATCLVFIQERATKLLVLESKR